MIPPQGNAGMYSGTSQIRTSRIRLPPQYDRFFIDGFFSLLCLTKSYLPNTITSQTRYTMMKIGRNTIGHNIFSEKISYLRVNYRQIDHDGVDLSDFRGICPPFSLDNATRMISPAARGSHSCWLPSKTIAAHSIARYWSDISVFLDRFWRGFFLLWSENQDGGLDKHSQFTDYG